MKAYKNVADYIKQAPREYQAQLKEVQNLVKTTVRGAEETIAYGMPAYMWNTKPLFYFAAMKGHLGLYPTSEPIKILAKELKDFSTSKGCVRVPWGQKVPKGIIVKLLKERVREIKAGM